VSRVKSFLKIITHDAGTWSTLLSKIVSEKLEKRAAVKLGYPVYAHGQALVFTNGKTAQLMIFNQDGAN
jgi:hypothetical protein